MPTPTRTTSAENTANNSKFFLISPSSISNFITSGSAPAKIAFRLRPKSTTQQKRDLFSDNAYRSLFMAHHLLGITFEFIHNFIQRPFRIEFVEKPSPGMKQPQQEHADAGGTGTIVGADPQ